MSRIKVNTDNTAREALRREIRVRRAYLNMTQAELASSIGVLPSSMSNLLANPDKLSVGRLRGIINTLDLDPWIILHLLGYSSKDVRTFQQRILVQKQD